MRSQAENEKFVRMIANNVGYLNKVVAVQQILQFLRFNDSFSPYEGFRNNGPDSFFSFIEIIGFMQIGGILSKTYVGVPKNYPQVPPIFLVNFNRNVHEINDYNRLISQKIISIEKNELDQEYIKLKLPILTTNWNSNCSLQSTFKEVERIISQPPIIYLKRSVKQQEQIRWQNQLEEQRNQSNIGNVELQGIGDKITKEILETKENYDRVLASRQQLEYFKSRDVFISEYIPSVSSEIELKRADINKRIMAMNEAYSNSVARNSCEDYFDISEKDRRRIELISEQEALRIAEKDVRRKIEGGADENSKFADYKKVVKLLYDKMFENQTELLRIAE